MKINRLILVLLLGVFTINTLMAGAGEKKLKEYPLTKFGKFIPNKSDKETIQTNFETINGAIEKVGEKGGGTIILPEGTYYIGPNLVPGEQDKNPIQAIRIAYDNITIQGAGREKTILKTNGTFVKDAFMHGPYLVGGRGAGIRIYGTKDRDNPRKNIVLRDFELDGQAGWNGDYSLNYKKGSENGWDMWHKGIIATGNEYLEELLIENVYVHSFRGEVLYTGGGNVEKITVRNVKSGDTNASCFNLGASDLQVEDCEFGGSARFWVELGIRPSETNNQTNTTVFRNNTFYDMRVDGAGISMTQGNREPYAVVFENNTFVSEQGIFAVHGGLAGPIRLSNNVISCGGTVFEAFAYPGWEKSPFNSNIVIENNLITRAEVLAEIPSYIDDLVIRNNTFIGKDENSRSVEYGIGGIKNVVVEGNTFNNCLPPKADYDWVTIDGFNDEFTRPLFVDNEYNNKVSKDRHSTYYLTEDNPKFIPYYEYVEIGLDNNKVIPVFETEGYVDGQILHFTGPKWGITALPASQASYYVAEDRLIKYGKTEITFQFNAKEKKWIEIITEEK